MRTDMLYSLVVPVLVFGGVFAFIAFQARKARENLAALGRRLGFETETTGKFFKKSRLRGSLRGRRCEVYGYTTGSGKHQQHWSAVAVEARAPGVEFELKPRSAFADFFKGLFGKKSRPATGDATFDGRWELKTNRPDTMAAALLPEMCEKILVLGKAAPTAGFTLERGMLRYAEQGSFATRPVCDRMEPAAALVCDLADAIEVVAGMTGR